MKGRKAKITQDVIEQVRTLKEAGLSGTKIAKFLGISSSAIGAVIRSGFDLDAYKRYVATWSKKTPKSTADKVDTFIPFKGGVTNLLPESYATFETLLQQHLIKIEATLEAILISTKDNYDLQKSKLEFAQKRASEQRFNWPFRHTAEDK